MKQFNNKTMYHGFTLLEVLIFTGLISLIFIAMAYIAVSSLRTTKFNEHKILATRYAEELRDWLKGEKEKDWNNFPRPAFLANESVRYCFNSSPIADCGGSVDSCCQAGTVCLATPSNCGSEYVLGPASAPSQKIFLRYVTLTKDSQSRIKVEIKVIWKQGDNTYAIPHSTVFTLWE